MGILDGRNLENRSIPLLKMEVDVIPSIVPFTAGNFPLITTGGNLVNSTWSPSSFSLAGHNHDSQYISIITSPVAGNIPLMTSGGELQTSPYSIGNSQNQIPLNNNVLNVGLVAESVNGVNLSGLVTVAGAQTITGAKTFASDVVISGNLTVNGTTTSINTTNLDIKDAEITLNKNETGAGVTANGGLSGFRVKRGTAPDFLAVFDESIDKFRVGTVGSLISVSLEGHTHSIGSLNIPNGIGQSSNFAGAGSSTLITFSPAAPNINAYEVLITPKANPMGNLGEYWYEKISTTQFRVYNSGTATTGFFYMVWMS